MNNNDRITYEEFMIMFRNAPRMAYMLYDKAEDEIDKYKNVIEELKKWLKSQNQPMPNETVGYNYVFEIRISKVLDKLNKLLEETNE